MTKPFSVYRLSLLVILSLLGALGVALNARADTGIYMGAGYGKPLGSVSSKFGDTGGFKDSSWQDPNLYAGVRFLSLVAGEVGYTRWSSESNNAGTYKSDLLSAAALVYIPNPIPFFALYGKFGVASSNSKFHGESASASTPVWGIGAEFTAIPKINIRLGYDNFGKIGKADGPGEVKAAETTLSLNYRF